MQWCRLAANSGHTEAQNDLAYLYEPGPDGLKDMREAVKWYQRAANQGDIESATRLGKILLLGEDVENVEEAVKWWTMAADKGNAYAQFSLAELYASGTGVQRDLQKAYSLFTLSGRTFDVSKQLNQIRSQIISEDLAARQLAASNE